jgi:hypothetical protein
MPPRPALPPGKFENIGAGLEPQKARRGKLENPFPETRRPLRLRFGMIHWIEYLMPNFLEMYFP